MKKILTFTMIVLFSLTAFAMEKQVTIRAVNSNGVGKVLGVVKFKDTKKGVLITPNLRGLSPGGHGFHIHANMSCRPKMDKAALSAGGHFDPYNTKKHLGPFNQQGHLGDLPILFVKKDGTATTPIFAPKLKTSEIGQRSLMIHAYGDNYSDIPLSLGGGGPRVACGLISR